MSSILTIPTMASAKKKKPDRPTKISYLICYGPLHEQDELEVGGKAFSGKEFIFAGGIEPSELLNQGWKHGITWTCPDCVIERERRQREAAEEQTEQAKKSET